MRIEATKGVLAVKDSVRKTEFYDYSKRVLKAMFDRQGISRNHPSGKVQLS